MDTSVASIFVWGDGRPCLLFVEATSVRERPKLVRRIIKHGGIVVNAVREAQILLAENNTKEALELLDAWQGDKLILGTRWVASCIEQGQFLGEDCGWAGCLLNRETLVKGINVQSDDSEGGSEDDQIVVKRVSRPRPKASPRSKSESHPSRPLSPSVPSSSRTPYRPSPPNGRGDRRASSSTSGPAPPEYHHHQDSEPSSPTDPGPSSSQHQHPTSSQPNSQQQLFSSLFNNLLQPPSQQQMPNLFPPPAALSQFGSFAPLTTSFPQFNPSQIQLLQQLMLNQQQLNSQAMEQQQSPAHQQPPADHDGTSERPTPEDVLSSDAAYDEPNPSPLKNKGKARARSESYDADIQTAIRSKPMPSKPVVTQDRDLFVNNQGTAQTFYIMVDLKNRKDLLKIAKKHRGAIVSEMEQADYIILNSRSNQYQKLLGTLPISKIALAPGWLETCDREERVVDMAPFVIDVTSGVGQGAMRKRPVPGRKTVKADPVECESEEENPPSLNGNVHTDITPQRPANGAIDATRSRSRSPSPPTRIVVFNSGKNIFTHEDRTWFFKYLRFKLERDPQLSLTSLMKLAASKAPHHSAKSWESMWRRGWGNDMATLRKDIAQLSNHPANPIPSTPSTSSEARYRSPSRSQLSQNTTARPSGPPRTPRNEGNILQYPEDGSTSPCSPDARPPPSSAPVSQASTQATPVRITSETLKRKDSPIVVHSSPPNDNRYSKKARIEPENVIDVDSYSNVAWFKTS